VSTFDHERRIQLLFVAVAIVFPFQYWFAKHVTEPYPALLLPSFKGTAVNEAGEFAFESADVVVAFGDGASQTVSLRTLFADAPSSQFKAMAKIALKPKRAGSPPPRLRTPGLEDMIPGYVLSQIRHYYWSGVELGTVNWIRGRIKALFPNRTVLRVDVVWYTEVCILREGQLTRHRRHDAAVEIPL
jgi:hypothetical protein